jgi:hypothetical protein
MLSLQQELFGNTVRKVGKVRKVRKIRRTKTFIFKNKKIPGEKFVVRFDLKQIKRHLSGKAKPSDRFVVVKRILNNKVIEHFGIEHFAWFRRAVRSVSRGVSNAARRAKAAAERAARAARDAAARAARAAREAARRAAEAAKRAAEAARRKAQEAARRVREVAEAAARKAKEIANKAKAAMEKGLNMLKGVDPRQIAKLMSIFKNQQKAMQNAEARKQAELARAQNARWAAEESREAKERRRMEAELAKNKTDDTVKTPLPKFDTSTINDINIGPKVSSSLGNSKNVNPPKINYSMNVKESPGSGEFGTNIKTMEDFTNIGSNNSFKICSIVLLSLLVFLFYYYTA